MTNHSRGKALLLAVVFVTTGLAITLGYTHSRAGLFPTTAAVASPLQTKASADGIDTLKMSVLLSDSEDSRQTSQEIAPANHNWLRSLLFLLLVFASGWIAARIRLPGTGKQETTQSRPDETPTTERTPPQTTFCTSSSEDHATPQNPVPQHDSVLARRVQRRDKRIGMLKRRIKELKNKLAQSSRMSHTAMHRADGPPLSNEQQLQKHIRAQAAIIAALEDLIRSNRHKWLHRDAMEAQLRSRITELDTDLQATMRLLDQRQRDVS